MNEDQSAVVWQGSLAPGFPETPNCGMIPVQRCHDVEAGSGAALVEAEGGRGAAALAGEDLDALSRELGVTAATLSGWRDQFSPARRAR